MLGNFCEINGNLFSSDARFTALILNGIGYFYIMLNEIWIDFFLKFKNEYNTVKTPGLNCIYFFNKYWELKFLVECFEAAVMSLECEIMHLEIECYYF